MANIIQWGAALSASTVVSTEMNSLANDARTNQGTEYDNSTGLNVYGWLELYVTFGSSPSDSAPHVKIYMMGAPDGTNYTSGSSSVAPGDHSIVGSVAVQATTNAQRLMLPAPVMLPPGKVKFIVENQAGTAFAASGNTLKLFIANPEIQ